MKCNGARRGFTAEGERNDDCARWTKRKAEADLDSGSAKDSATDSDRKADPLTK